MKYWTARLMWSQANQLLDQEEPGLLMTARQYYNQGRHKRLDAMDPATIDRLRFALKEAGFEYHCVFQDKINDAGITIARQLVQIVFWHQDSVVFIKRFIAGHLLEVDYTFNTNRHRRPLLSAVGITNEGQTFPAAFSYVPGETEACFITFFSALRENLFVDCPEPAVVLTDKAAGMIKAVKNDAIPNSQFQPCSWHVHQAIVKHIHKRYTDTELDGVSPEKAQRDAISEIPGLKKLI
jgi:hypothetical protein